DHKVNQTGREPYFLVDGKLKFRVCDATASHKMRYTPDTIYARYNTEIGKDNQIPLWLFGFLY
ncbi:MAG: ATP-binding protein, partial [Bacteroidaceae bacterium]|nr:ATP-binding protein [Bacteroidaceae bacterium]